MKIRFLGAGTDAGDGATLDELRTHLLGISGKKVKLGIYERHFYCKQGDGDYILGVLITVKDQKRFCELQDVAGKLKVVVNTLGEENSLMEFNFFLMNCANGQILYQHYHQSCSLLQFGKFLQEEFKKIQNKNKQAKKDATAKLTKKAATKINKEFKKGLGFQLMVRPEKLEELMREINTVRDFEIDFFELQAPEDDFAPLAPFVRKERRKFSFAADTKTSVLIGQFKTIISSLQIDEGRITGKDANGVEKIVKISENPDNFGEYDFDDVAMNLHSLDIDDFEQNWLIQELNKQANKYSHIFDVEIE